MSEWHLTPEYINRRWTEELLALMFRSRERRLRRSRPGGEDTEQKIRHVSEDELFAEMGVVPETVN